MATTAPPEATFSQTFAIAASVKAFIEAVEYRDGETRPQRDHRIVKYVHEMIKDSVTTSDIKAKGHLVMAVTLSEGKMESFPGEAKGHFTAAHEEIEKAKAVYVSENLDENLRKLKDELEKKEAHFRKREQEAKGEAAEEVEGRV